MRNGYYLFLLVLTCWLSAFVSLAQTQKADPSILKIIPPAPNAASLGIYGEIPVSKYTGVPNIEVPLYTLEVGSLSLPISLKYHASGIKVAQEASWVGLGWSLNAGGVISRSIKGNDDFSAFNGYLRNTPFPNCSNGACTVSTTNWYAWDDIKSGREDAAPDEFYYNVAGYSGKMVYVRNTRKFLPLKAENLDITYNGGWVLTTPTGVRYVFATTETTSNYSLGNGSELPQDRRDDIINYNATPPAITSWYLDSVVAPTKEYIKFSYKRSNCVTPSIVSESQSFHWLYRVQVPLCPPRETGRDAAFIYYKYFDDLTEQVPSYNYSQSATEEMYLQEIRGSNGRKISFVTDDRQDFKVLLGTANRPQKLTRVIISSSGTDKTLQHEFAYSYFPIPNGTPDAQLYKYLRLRLDQVKTSADGLAKPPYQFSYSNKVLPAKTSKSIDHWGFYNGATENDSAHPDWDPSAYNGSLIPSYLLYIPNEDGVGGVDKLMRGANRDPNETFVQNGMLTGITYPTGGTTTFKYGINRYHKRFYTTRYTRDLVRVRNRMPRNAVAQRVYKNFEVKAPGNVTVHAYSYPIPFGEPDYRAPSIQETCPNGTTKIYRDPNTGDIPSLVYCCVTVPGGFSQGSYLGWIKYNDPNTPITCGAPGPYTITTTIHLPRAGTYELNLLPTSAVGFLSEAWITYEEDVTTAADLPGGGVRIEQITSHDGRQNSVKTYAYTQKSDSSVTAISSGVMLAPIAYHYMADPVGFIAITGEGTQDAATLLAFSTNNNRLIKGRMLMASSASCLPLGTSGSGSSVGYSQITETIGTVANPGGQVLETFINEPERASSNGGAVQFFPGIPNLTRNENGLLKQSLEFAANGRLVKSVENTYSVSTDTKTAAGGVIVYGGYPKGGCNKPSYALYYEHTSEWWRKVSDTTRTYTTDPTTQRFLQTVNTYRYDPINLLVNEQTTRNSAGEVLTTKTAFAHNAPSETQMTSADLAALTARHMIGLPIKQESFVGSKRVQAKLTNYNAQQLPASVQLLEGNQLPVRLVYDRYDEQGNLTQYHAASDVATAILWGYSQAEPVIFAKNVTYARLAAAATRALQAVGFSGLSGLNDFLTFLGDLSAPQQQTKLRAFVKLVQDDADLRRAQVTVHTYHPLFGKLSETDATGRTIRYEYDALGRLLRTRDEQGRILSQQQYHYAGK